MCILHLSLSSPMIISLALCLKLINIVYADVSYIFTCNLDICTFYDSIIVVRYHLYSI